MLSESEHATVSVSASEKASLQSHGWFHQREKEKKTGRGGSRELELFSTPVVLLIFCYSVCATKANMRLTVSHTQTRTHTT